MRHLPLALGLVSLSLLAGCQDSGTPEPTPPPAPASTPGGQTGALVLQLDDGKKWTMDDHTRASAARMDRLVREAEPVASVEDAQALAGRIDDELRTLIQGCTMTGPAHDQLHGFLAALFPAVARLKNATDVASLRQTQREIVGLFDDYPRYFE